MPTYEIEDSLLTSLDGIAVAGIDEVGAGPWAGPVTSAAVVLPTNGKRKWFKELNDSKKMTAKAREAMFDVIMDKALAVGVGWGSVREIDANGLYHAVFVSMSRAYNNCAAMLGEPVVSIVDGKHLAYYQGFLGGKDSIFIDKGDQKSVSVAAASIIAKVTRDAFMIKVSERYPEYGFARHKGYGTEMHRKALAKHGPCPLHRQSFRPVKRYKIVEN